MADRRGNIDLVFRNGLKDFEVLPPQEVWDNIKPSINRRRSSLPVLKAAAAVAAIAVTSYLAYRLGMEVSSGVLSDDIAYYRAQAGVVSSEPMEILKPPLITMAAYAVGEDGGQTTAEMPAVPVMINEDTKSVNHLQNSAEVQIAYEEPLPGLQNTFQAKHSGLEIPEFQPLTYDLMPGSNEVPGMTRWSVTALASPTYYSQFAAAGNNLAQQVIESDKTRLSYTGGFGLSYKLSSRLSIQSGMYYSSIGQMLGGLNAYSGFQQYDYTKGDHNFEIVTANGTVHTNNSDIFLNSTSLPDRINTYYTSDQFDPVKSSLKYVSSDIYQDLSFLELPLILRYKVVDRKIDLNLIGGMSYNFLVNNSVYTIADGGRYPVGTTEGLNSVYLSSSLGMGMEYNLSESFSLNLEPTFRYYLNPFNSGKTSGFHPYSLGVFSGISYRF